MQRSAQTDQNAKAEQFRGLHIPGNLLVLFNIWDPGSAKALATSGAKATGRVCAGGEVAGIITAFDPTNRYAQA